MEQNNVENPKKEVSGAKPSIFRIIWSPVEQFEKIRNRPTFWIPLLIVTVLSVVGTYFSISQMDYSEILGETVPADQMDTVMTVSKIFGAVASVFAPIIALLISAAIYLLIAKIAGSEVTFKQLLSMKTFIMLISAVGLILNGLISIIIDTRPDNMITSLAGVMGSENAVLGSIELFTIWGVVLTAIGLQKVAQFSKGLSWTISIAFYLISIGFTYVSSIISGLSTM
ncbi:Yip1 family protein [Bacillus massiliigorillae]|uniref:Yip1 family protein n=1 Tax=Bacillus massiliigorillae TaxID=1243664 RepID=UPI00039DF8DE|nr:Yip1 family protein [Bacillus massiliigorillae]